MFARIAGFCPDKLAKPIRTSGQVQFVLQRQLYLPDQP